MTSSPQFNLRVRLICSVSPFLLPTLRRPYAPDPRGGGSAFRISVYSLADREAKAPPCTLEIFDSFQANMDELMALNVEKRHKTPNFVGVDAIASDILTHWAATELGAPAEASRGVWLSAGPQAMEEETAIALQRLSAHCEFLYYQAVEAADKKDFNLISKKHKTAAKWLGKEETWVQSFNERANALEVCPLCQFKVPLGSYVCGNCRHIIRALPEEFAILNQPKRQAEQPRRQG